jgi:hypothetical protein
VFQPRGLLFGYSIRVETSDYPALKEVATGKFGPGHDAVAFQRA